MKPTSERFWLLLTFFSVNVALPTLDMITDVKTGLGLLAYTDHYGKR